MMYAVVAQLAAETVGHLITNIRRILEVPFSELIECVINGCDY